MRKLFLALLAVFVVGPAFSALPAKLNSPQQSAEAKHITKHYVTGITVTTSNVFDLRSAFDGSDLLSTLPSMNEDLLLLKQHQKFNNTLPGDARFAYPHKALLEISGEFSGVSSMGSAVNNPTAKSTSQFYNELFLDDAKLQFNAFITPWLGTFIEIGKASEYNYTPQISLGWLTIGNLDAAPVYFTIGKMHVPFGKYSSSLVTDPMTKVMFTITKPAAVLGYSKAGLYAEAYTNSTASNNATANPSSPSPVSQTKMSYGVNAGYQMDSGRYSLDFGAGWVSNINDSGTFGAATQSSKRWGAFDVHAEESLQLKNWKLGGNAEFISTIGKAPEQTMLSFGDKAAQPMALNVEINANTKLMNRPFGLFLDYGQTWQALGLNAGSAGDLVTSWTNIPQYMVGTGFNVSIWQDTIISMEYRHNFTYDATASNAAANSNSTHITQNGTQENIVSTQISAYF